MKERIAVFAAVAATLLLSYSTPALTGEAAPTVTVPDALVPAAIAAAIADANRPQANVALDARRNALTPV
jgi:predicted methyltransferase